MIDNSVAAEEIAPPVKTAELDRSEQAYRAAVDLWVAAIREEESLATTDHSDAAWERWEHAGFKTKEAEKCAANAREVYKSALRQLDFGI